MSFPQIQSSERYAKKKTLVIWFKKLTKKNVFKDIITGNISAENYGVLISLQASKIP
jgi:hypothetical protein